MTIPRFRRAAAAMALSAMALTKALTTSPASAAPTSSAEAGVVDVTDTAVLTVLHNSKKLTSTEATQKQLAAEKANKEFVIVYDPASSRQGIAHAFDSRAAADAYGKTLKPVSTAKVASTSTTASTSRTMAALPTTCYSQRNISRMYDGYNCVGDMFPFSLNNSEPAFSTYGWQNKGNSLLIGYNTVGCQILIRLYPGPNYTYTEARFYGSPNITEYYRFNDAQTNNFESGRSTCS